MLATTQIYAFTSFDYLERIKPLDRNVNSMHPFPAFPKPLGTCGGGGGGGGCSVSQLVGGYPVNM